MNGYIILNNSYGSNDPMFVSSIAVSTSRFGYDCIHTDEKLYNFYKDDKDYKVLFISESKSDPVLRKIIESLYKEKDESERNYNSSVRALNKLNEYYG